MIGVHSRYGVVTAGRVQAPAILAADNVAFLPAAP